MKSELLQAVNLKYRNHNSRELNGISLRVFQGELLGIVGHSEAGVGSLVQLLAGNKQAEEGYILVKNVPAPASELKQVVGFIGRQSRLVYSMAVWENLLIPTLGKKKYGLISRKKKQAVCKRILEELELPIQPGSSVEKLPLVYQHILLMAKAMLTGKQVLILDEIDAQYTLEDCERLEQSFEYFISLGITIVFTANRWCDVLALCQRVIAVRDGKCVKTFWEGEQTQEQVNNYLHGFLGQAVWPMAKANGGGAKGLKFAFDEFCLSAGEFLAIYDRDHTADGLVASLSKQAKKNRWVLALIQAESMEKEWVPGFSVLDNLLLPIAPRVSNYTGYIDKGIRRIVTKECCQSLNLSEEAACLPVTALPRKDAIRLLFYRWQKRRPQLYLLVNPTACCDLEESEIFCQMISPILEQGIPVVYLSSNKREVYHLSDAPLELVYGQLTREEVK